MDLASTIDYSIIICTYNPDERLLGRCLNAVYNLNTKGLKVEVLLIDNNSSIPLHTTTYIQDFIAKINGIKIIVEMEQGLTPARMAGIREAKGNYVVFFDDDNEAEESYLQELARLHKEYENVAAWGPGRISVDFIDGIAEDIEVYARSMFQERDDKKVEYANSHTWQHCYPFGTGMSVKTSYLKTYERLVSEGKFTLPDRQGNSLSSGGDVQIILYCLREGASAGVSPGLKMNHIIPTKRANYRYIKRLLFGAHLGGSVCVLEVFPEHSAELLKSIPAVFDFSKTSLKKYFKLLFKPRVGRTIEFVSYIGNACGIYIALGRPIPLAVRWVTKRMDLD